MEKSEQMRLCIASPHIGQGSKPWRVPSNLAWHQSSRVGLAACVISQEIGLEVAS